MATKDKKVKKPNRPHSDFKIQLGNNKEIAGSVIDNCDSVIDFKQLRQSKSELFVDEVDEDLMNLNGDPSKEDLNATEEPDIGVDFPLFTETHPPGGIPAQCEDELFLKYMWYRKIRCWFLLSGNWMIQSGVVRGYLGLYHERFLHILSFPYIIHPYSNFYWTWEFLTCLLLSLTLIIEPYQLTFDCFVFVNDTNRKISLTMSIILLIDMLLKFRVGKAELTALKITLDPIIIRQWYFRRMFWYDLISRFPYDTIMLALLPPEELKVKTSLTYVRLVTFFVKLLRVEKVFDFTRHAAMSMHLNSWNSQIMEYGMLAVLCLHWGACFHWLLPDIVNAYCDQPKKYSWITHLNLWNKTPPFQYLNSYLRSLSNLLTLDGGEFIPHELEEMLCTCTLILVALTLFAYFVSSFSAMALESQKKEEEFGEMIELLEEYLNARRVPSWLRHKLLAYYEKKYKSHGVIDESIFRNMSSTLRIELLSHICKRIVEKVYMFSGIPTAVMQNIVQRLTYEIYVPGDVVMRPGINLDALFFINDGEFRILSEDGHCLKVLTQGEFFGESSILYPGVAHTITIVATNFAEVYKLSKHDFASTMAQFPQVLQKIMATANLKVNAEIKKLKEHAEQEKAGVWKGFVERGKQSVRDYYADIDKGVPPGQYLPPEMFNYLPAGSTGTLTDDTLSGDTSYATSTTSTETPRY